jgi:hypothetical protein
MVIMANNQVNSTSAIVPGDIIRVTGDADLVQAHCPCDQFC